MKITKVNVPVYQIEMTEDEINGIREELLDISSEISGNHPNINQLYSKIAAIV